MSKTIKTAISVPVGTFRRAENFRRKTGKSRSALYSAALESYFKAQEVREKEARYEAGYREKPETEAETSWITAAGLAGLDKEDW